MSLPRVLVLGLPPNRSAEFLLETVRRALRTLEQYDCAMLPMANSARLVDLEAMQNPTGDDAVNSGYNAALADIAKEAGR